MVRVTISDGVLEGELIKDDLVKFYSFKGIPFAAPPVGDLRFKAPQPVQPWKGVRSAKAFGSTCFQYDIITTIHGTEDCLFLYVYTPDMKPRKPLPVMVWIHGGGYMSGSGNDDIYGPEFLIRQGVILVTFNYRVEVLGFLCLYSEEVPGNAGMKDQVAALKWVNKHISRFGGDSGNVTIFGESAGGSAVAGHTLSPMSKGLFKRSIAQSGTAANQWSIPWGPFKSAISLARKLGFYSEDKKELYEFFKSQPLENLIGAKETLTLYDTGKGFADSKFAMALEIDFGQERFLIDDPYESLRYGIHEGVDMIVGFNEDEGVFWSKVENDVETAVSKIKRFDDYLVPRNILLNSPLSVTFKVGRKFKQYYFGNNFEFTSETVQKIFKFYSMDMFKYDIVQWAKFCSNAKKNNIYLYKLTCKFERNFMSHVLGLREHLGDKPVVSHTDDLSYLFPIKMSGIKVKKESDTFKYVDQINKLWTNLAEYGGTRAEMVQVTINDGILEGELVEDDLVKFYSFKGIPFAAPPVGDLRFKAPQPVQPWGGVRPAKTFRAACYQLNLFTNAIEGSDDCLYLNVYTPDLKPTQPLPVMVWIHGGGFISGSGNDDLYGPEFLLRHEVIIVTFNYRVEVLGFLCLDSEEVPGNAGMKDQVAALKWVNKNIHQFGGDSGNVTIFGLSSGGACASAQALSPMTKGLFKRAIAQSGIANARWSIPWGPFESALSLARKLGFNSADKKELYDFFKSQPIENLIGIKEPFTLYDYGKGFIHIKFAMVLEKDFGQDRFLIDDPYDSLRDGVHEGVDMIVGYTEDEGVFWPKIVGDFETAVSKIRRFDDYLVPRNIFLNSSLSVTFEVGRKFKEYYLGNNFDSQSDTISKIFKFCSMDLFAYDITQWAKICSNAKKNNIYLYKFTCKSERNFMTDVFEVRKYIGDKVVVCHADDLPYIFPVKLSGKKVAKESETFKLIDQVTKLWTNFAKNGNPTPDDSFGAKWKPYNVKEQKYFEIGNQFTSKSYPEAEEMEFWESIFKQFCPKYVFH